MNTIRKITSVFLLLILLLICAPASSQICRVSSGSDSSGDVRFIDVYEYDYVSCKPEFPGGDAKLVEYINKERQYPRQAYRRGVQGRVTCSFVVNTNGAISHVCVVRGVENTLDSEAVRIFEKMPSWHPGSIDGRCVPVRVIRSVPFRK